MLVVNAAMKIDSARELAALAKERPGAITIGVTGLGAISHLGLELFQASAGVKFQAVPYRGASQAVTDLIGGRPHRPLRHRPTPPAASPPRHPTRPGRHRP